MSMDLEEFRGLAKAIEAIGIGPELAARYARLIGDVPVRDEGGHVLVIENGKTIASLRLDFFDEKG